MTSTNDGKDVKSNPTSGHKSKSYYIDLYTSLEKALSSDSTLEERTARVCEAWRHVYSLYQHSATSTHPHLLRWLQRHTANTVLQSKWAKSKNEQARLTNAIDALVAEVTAAAAAREQHPWEKLLLQRAAWFRKAVDNPWDNPVLKSLINPNSEPVTDQQVLEWLISEHGTVLVARLQRMVGAGNCDDLALLLASAVMDRARAAVVRRADYNADERVEEEDHSSFVAVLEREASFTAEEWEMLTDIELVLLLKTDKRPRCIELAKLTPLRHGYKMVERLRKRLEMFPRDKKLWKHAKEAATLVAQMVIARCMVAASCVNPARDALYWCARALARLVADRALRSACTKLAAPAATARHLHTFCAALINECKELKTEVIMKPFICELYVRAITTGIYELEKLKLIPEKEAEARLYERTLAGWFMQLGERLTDSARLRAECCLTAFSVHPVEKHYQRVADTTQPPSLQTIQEPTPESTSEYGSWANDSRTQSNLVKTSETLQLKQSQQHQANVLSTAILTEGEALGLETVLCQDLAVILSGPRVKTLSWDMDREVLLENCRTYMEKTHGGTRAVTTELKYLNLDPAAYRHLPEEGDDESGLYYGIEKGYEHEVQFEEPEDIWQNGFFDPEQTESANDSEVDRQMKKKSKAIFSEDDEDPLSNIAEAKREKKKSSKEKSKDSRKKSHKRDESKDGSRERRKDKDKKTKKERKNKSEQPTPGSLTSLLGMKVSKISAQVQDGEKRVRKKKERRREPKTMFSYVSVTDSNYDSQVKSQASEHDPNVLVDGVFSMDELGSPEKTNDSQKPIDSTKTTFNNATVQSPVIKDIKTRPMSSPHSTASDSDVSRAKSPYLTPNQRGPRHVVGSKVKSSIAKLLQFRRNKSQVRDVPRPPPSRTPTNPAHSLVGMKIYKPEDVSKVYLNQTQSTQLEAISKELCDLLHETSSSENYRTAPETDNRLQNQNLYNVQKYQQQYGDPHHIPQTYNENQKHSEYTLQSPIKPAHQVSSQSHSSVIHANYTSPIKTPEHMRTNTLNFSPPKQTMAYQSFHKSMQNISTETKYDPPKKPQLINDLNYFSQQHAKSNSSPLSPRIISNTCIKPPSQMPIQQYSETVKDNTTTSPQTYSNVHGTNTPRGPAQARSQITDPKKDVMKYVPKQLSSSMQNINELPVPGRYDAIKTHIPTPNTLHGQAAKPYTVKSQNDTSNASATLYNSNITTASRCLPIQHRERADKTSQKPNINYEEYVKELMKSISESNGHDKNRTLALNKDVKLTPVPPSTSVQRVDSVTPQCAKQLIQLKKTENAPNTFSRRSYMHKNKQSENKLSLTDSITLELNRTMLDHKISKAKSMKNEVTISRVGPSKQNSGNVIRKLEKPCSRLQRDCPVLSSMLDAFGTPKIQTISNTANSNMLGNQPNREDADLLLLLRNQNVSTLEALPSDTSGQALNNSQIKVEVSSAHRGLVGTKVKNINILDTPIKSEPEEDWKRVMDDILAHKTEPLGPNALDLALKKQNIKYSQSSSRVHSSDKHRLSGQSSSHNKPVDAKKREHYSSKASSSRKPSTEKHSEIPKKPREPEIIKKTTTEMLNRPEILNKHFSSTIPKEVSQMPVIQNSDYDNLDDLLDEDLRRELGEISSDEDAYNALDAALLKGKTQSNIPKTVSNVYKAANTSKEKPHIVNPKTIPKNPNVAGCNRRFAVNTCSTTGYPNVINNSSHPTHIANKPTAVNPETRQHTATSTIITNQVAHDTANNIVTSHIGANQFMSNVLPANVIIASVPQPSVVVIRQDLVYDPYPTIRIHESQVNAELCTVNKNMYALNATPNIAVYQTTQYAAPVINPIIIGNAMTTTNVSKASAMGNAHDTPDRMKNINREDQDSVSLRLTDNGNQSPEKSTKSLEAKISHSDDRSLTPEISTNLDFNMNRNCERKVLSQVQEKHPNDNVDKDSHLKRSPDDNIPLKLDEDRIKLKRQSLMNRKISHAVDHPIIPLTYTPLNRKVNLEKQLQRETPKNGIVKPNLISIPNSTTDIEKAIVISTSEKCPQSEANNENIESTDQALSVKENQKSCRRTWLRSSNKIRNKVSPTKRSRVPLKRNKIELKVSDKEALKKLANVESKNKDGVKNLKRVSNRILNKVKVIKPPTNQPPTQEAMQQNDAVNDELIDFEEALSGTIVLKSPTTMSESENTTKEPKCNSTEVEKVDSGAAVDEQHTILNTIEYTKVTTPSNKTSDIRLEPTVVIEKLKNKLGDQLIIKRSSVKTPVNKAKVIVIKKNRPVLRNRSIIKKSIFPIEATSNKIIMKEAPKNTVSAAAVPDNTNKVKPVVIKGQKVRKATPISTPLVRVETNKLVDQKVIEHISAVGAPIPLDDNNTLKPALDDQYEASKLKLPAAEQKVTELITAAGSQSVIETTVKDDVKVIETAATSSAIDLEKKNKKPIAVDDQKVIKQTRPSRPLVIADDTNTLKSTAVDNRDVVNQTSSVEWPLDLNESNKSKPRAIDFEKTNKNPIAVDDQKVTKQTRPSRLPVIVDETNTLKSTAVDNRDVVNQTSSVELPLDLNESNKSKPRAIDFEKTNKKPIAMDDQKVIKQTRPRRLPVIVDETNILKSTAVDNRDVVNQTSSVELPLDLNESNKSKPRAIDFEKTNKKPIAMDDQKVIKQTRPSRLPVIVDENNTLKSTSVDNRDVVNQTSSVELPLDLNESNKSKPRAIDFEKTNKKPIAMDDQKVIKQTRPRRLPVIVDENNTLKSTAVDNRDVVNQTSSVELPLDLNESNKSKPRAIDFEKTNKKPIAMDDQKVIKQTRPRRLPVIVDETNILKSTAVDNRDVVNQTSSVELPLDLNESNKSKPRAMDDQELTKHTASTPESSTTEQKRHDNDSPDCIKAKELEMKNQLQTYKTNSTLSSDSEKTSRAVETEPSTVINKANKVVQSNRSVIMLNFENSTKINANCTKFNESVPKPICLLSPQASNDVINHEPVTQNNSEKVIDISETEDVQPNTEVLKYNSNYEITRTGISWHNPLPKDNPNEDFKQKELKVLAENAKRPNRANVPNNDKQTFIKGDIKVEELPVINSKDPSKQSVRITLPNGKIFRATISGNIHDIGSLFSNPGMRDILAGGLNEGRRYFVNYKQVWGANKTNPTEILGTQIKDLNVKEIEIPIDTVNLISDDEDEVPKIPNRSFTTEFGKYTTNADAETCTLHQTKFNQKCEVKMYREEIIKSNKTKPNINFQPGTSLLTRNKSKLLSTAIAPVVPSTTTNVMPEVVSNPDISTHAQDTPIPNVIEIDDSSNDSIDDSIPKTFDDINLEHVQKIVEYKSLLPSDLGEQIDKNITFPLPKKKTVNLKSALLQDFGLFTAEDPVIDITADDEMQGETLTGSLEQNECLEKNPVDDITQNEEKKVDILTDIQTQNNKVLGDDPVVQNEERDEKTLTERQEQDNLKKCVVKLVNCDNLVKKYERMKTMKKCYVKLERLYDSIPKTALTSLNENTNDEMEETDEMNLDTDDFIDFDDDEPSGSQQLSRCPSLSILNNWDDDSQPLEILYTTSPVMEIYETIAQVRDKLKFELVRHPEKLLSWTCDSEWRMTKLGYIIEERLQPSNIPSLESKIVPDNGNVLVGGTENLAITFDAPKLVTITFKFLENNPDVLYRLESMRNLRRILTTKTSPNKLKRKTDELASDTVARKILKLGTLALNSLNSCIKILDGIRFSNIEENLKAQPDASSINNESSNHVIVESLPTDLTTTVENIKQMDDLRSTSDIENSEPETSETDLIPECENNVCSSQYIDAGPVNEDYNADRVESMLITDSNVTDDRSEEKCKEDTQDSQDSQPEKNTTDQCDNKEYSYATVEVTVVHEEANSSEETVPVVDPTTSPTGNRAEEEECKERTLDSNSKPDESKTYLDAQCKKYEECVRSAISVALIDEESNANAEETVAIADSNTSLTVEKIEENNDEDHEDCVSLVSSALIDGETNANAEETVAIADSNASLTVEKIEENNDENHGDCVSPVSAALIEEETNANTEETVTIADSNTGLTVEKIEENNDEDHEDCVIPISSALIDEATNANAEETVAIADSNTSLTTEKIEENNEGEPEKNTTNEYAQLECLSDPFLNDDTNGYPEETVQSFNSDMSQTDFKSEEINDPLVNEDANVYAEETVQTVDSDMSPTDLKTEEISDPLVNGDSNAYSEETVQTVGSDMKPTSHKTEDISDKVNEDSNAYLEETVDSDMSPTDHETEEISDPLVNEDSNPYSEETVQTVHYDMSPTDHKTEEKYDQETNHTGNFIDDICKEQSVPAHREPDLVSEECETIKIEENENTPVNANLSVEESISYLPSENSWDKNVAEDIHTVESLSPLSNSAESGDTESQISVNVSVEQTTTEVPHIVNSDRWDEIPIGEISNDLYEVEVVDTNIDDDIDIVETLLEKSQEPITGTIVTNADSSEINHPDSAIKSPDFIDSKNIAFNYHDYTKQPKKKEDVSTSTINCRPDCEVNNDKDLLPVCTSVTDDNTALKVDSKENSCFKDTPINHTEVNTSENCTLKSNPDFKYELSQEDDLLTVKITTENDDSETKNVFIDPNDAEEETVASLTSDETDDNIDIKGFEFEGMYVFPLNQSASNSNNTSSDSLGQESNSESVSDTTHNDLHDIDFHVIEPEITYSRKRKIDMRDIRVPSKKYRKSKNIDCSKQTVISMADLAYGKEYKRLLEYCSSVKFSYTRPFHKECVEVDDLMTNWPIHCVVCDVPGDISEEHLFVDLHDYSSYQPDPMTQTFVEEINYEYDRTDAAPENPSSVASEVNFNMGFGEGSGRVIQILKKGVSNISAATLSDVKQSQPVFKSVDLDDCNYVTTKKDDQIKKIRQYVNFIELRDKVRTFFKKSSDELKSDWLQKAKDTDLESKCHYRYSREEFPFDLCSLDYVKPLPTNAIVQVVQVGQLPVSAAAQNPVTCDPRVTQVSDASPSQCSVDNSPNDDSQSEIKTEYTELTTADLTLPLQGYAQQNQANLASNDSNLEYTEQTISLEMEIKAEESPEIKKEMPDIKDEKSNSSDTDLHTLANATPENMDYSFETNTAKSDATYDSSEQNCSETFSQQRQQNGTTEKTDQIAHAMNAAGITTTSETVTNTRAHALVNILSQKIRQGSVNTTQTTTNTYSKTTSINAMALQQALAQILPPPLNQTVSSENNQAQSTPVGPQVLHIVQGKNASGNQITLVDNSQQSVISTPNATQVLHIVQNKNANPGQASNGTLTSQGNSFSGLSLVDAGLQQGGNQLLHIVNTGNQKNTSPGQLLKRVNLLTNLTNVQGSNEQKMVQFVCKSADGKAIQLNAPHQRSMVLRLQPIETPNVQTPPAKPAESQDPSPSPTGSASSKESASQQEIKSRSIYEENYAKFIQNSNKTPGLEKSTSLPKFNQAFGKPVFQDGQKQSEAANNNSHLQPVNTNTENTEDRDNTINLEHIGQISSPPLLLRKQPVVTSASQPNIVQQIKQTIAPMNIQTMHGGVIYTRQIPVNIGGGQTINLITVPSTELINDDSSKSQAQNNQGEIEPSIIKIVPQSQTTSNNESSQEESNNHASGSNENAQTPQPQPVLTQMRIKLPMLSKAPQMVPGARVVRPSFFQIQRNVIGGNNQPVYQQLVLTAAPPLGQQTIRLPQAQASRPVKAPSESQSSSSESQMSTSTLEQLREFDMVLEQVKERSTVQPSTNSNNSSFKIHTTSSDTTDGNGSSNCSTESTPQVLYSIGNNQSLNVAYVNRKTSVTTPTTSTYVRSPDSSGIADSPTSSTHVQIPHTVTTDSSPTEMSQSKPAKVGSKSKSRPKSTSNPPNTLKLNSVPPKTSSQKPLEDEQTTQRILYILAEYKEQVENSPDKDKPAPRRRSNPPSNPGSSKRKKSSSSRRSGTRDMSPIHGEDTCRTMGSEDSSCGTSQGDCTESCLDSHSPQDSPRKVARKITFDQDLTVTQPRPQPQRNVIVADGQTITVARGTTGKPATAVLMPANYILPVSMMKGGQQIAIVTNRGPKLLTVGGEAGATNALLLQRLIGPAGLKPVLTRPGVRHVRLPTAALHNLQAFNLATATTVQPPDSTASPTPGPTPPELVDTRATSSPWTERDEVKPERGSSPEGSEPWNLPSSADAHEYTYEETVRTDNMDRTVLDPIPDRYSPDMEAQRIFDKMFDVDSKKSYAVDSHDDSPRCAYDIDPSDCDDKAYQVVHKKDGSHRQHRLSHVSAAALRHKYAILEHELRLQKSLSEECEDLGVDSPSASELFPEAELLFAASPAHEHNQEHHSHTPQPLQSSIPHPDMDDQIATDHLIPREIDVSLGLGDVGIVAVSEDGSATIALDQEEFARAHPNTTFHSEPTDGEVQPFTITGLKGRHITSTIFHSNAPATVLMTAPQATVISQAPDHSVKYEIENMINSMPSSHNNDVNLSSVLVKDDGLTRFDNILTDSRELHLTNTASAIVHSSGNATQVIRRVCYEDDKRERDARYLIDEPDNLIAGDDAKMIAEDSSRDATLESMADVDDDGSSPERHAELFWESNSASERSESRRPLDFSSDSDKCCKSPSFDETNSTDSSGVGSHLRLDSVIKEARTRERSGSLDGSSADDAPPLRTYPAKRPYQPAADGERSVSGKTRPHPAGVRRRASGRGVVKRGCPCCNGEPAPPRPKRPRQRKPTLDFHATN